MTGYHMTSGQSRLSNDGYGPREYRWKCTCGKRSAWFPTVERRDAAKDRHLANHADALR